MNVQNRITIELTGALLRAERTDPPYTQQCLTHWTQQILLGLLPASWIRKCVLSCLWGTQVSAGLLGWGEGPTRWGYLVPFQSCLSGAPLTLCLEKSPCQKTSLSSSPRGLKISLSLCPLTLPREKKSLHIAYQLFVFCFSGIPSQKNICKCLRYKEDQGSLLQGGRHSYQRNLESRAQNSMVIYWFIKQGLTIVLATIVAQKQQ